MCCMDQTSWRAAEAHMLQLMLHDLQVQLHHAINGGIAYADAIV